MNNLSEFEPIRSERATVKFFDGLEVEGYRMPSGEFRVGLEGASKVLGFAENWLPRHLVTSRISLVGIGRFGIPKNDRGSVVKF